MAIIIGYFIVLGLVVLDVYYHVYVNSDSKTYIHTPFDAVTGQYGFFYEEDKEKTNV